MPSTGLNGPYRLDSTTIGRIGARTSPGAYALGQERDGTFYISYVGRSDDDVAARLRCHLGDYHHFKFGYYASANEAFIKECHLWHDFGGTDGKLDNKIHPDRPSGSRMSCPRCHGLDQRVAYW